MSPILLLRLAPLAAVAALPVALPALAQPTGDLASVQRHLAAVDTMVAAFSQTDRAGKVLTGTLTLKKPGRIRFQYEKGVPILIVGDGKALYFLDYQVRQKQRWPIGESPLGILLNPARDPSKFARVLPTGDSRVIRVEAYDPKHPEYGRIDMIFARDAAAPGGLRLQGWVALDAQNNRTTIRLSNTRFNVPVSDNTFRWRDPTSRTRPN
ncbi:MULTISPECIES: LolA family protein [unclassified Sphingomonas]|uniref:LolA family protein n=1 Tax=unclassified Sphingomonas TaxID=196159 RepID=UPI00082F5CAE|nr:MULTISPECIES: outer membrane lipoprotein carrier protein LolA [unclassified Sphingomonas]MCH4893712.1 outer membrane lipoprotein carrier protein LolA [Sphingomonas sp. SFZ2018-12]